MWPSGSVMPKSAGREEGAHGDEHGGEADQRVERGHQLRHRRHLDPLRDV